MYSKILPAGALALSCLLPLAAWGAAAAHVDFALGNVLAIDRAGTPRALAKGAEVAEGDTVQTRGGRAQLRFSDGAYVSLQPQTLFRIDQYQYNGKQDGNERGFFSLIQGGLRTITGLVGRTNKKNYQVNTGVATIGIRGTNYALNLAPAGLSLSVGEGEIVVSNPAGSLNFASGQSGFVANVHTAPVMTDRKTDLLPPQRPDTVPTFIEGNNTTSTGIANVFTLSGTLTLPSSVANTSGTYPNDNMVLTADIVTFAPNGSVAALTAANPLLDVKDFGNNGYIAWGRGKDASGGQIAYVTGHGTPASELQNIAFNTPVATYTVIGSTAPVGTMTGGVSQASALRAVTALASPSASNVVTGTLNAASLTANFALAKVDAMVNITIAGNNFVATSPGMDIQKNNGVLTFDCDTPPVTHGCPTGNCNYVSMRGMFAGPNAQYAGLTYVIAGGGQDPNSTPVNAVGAVAFGR